jgi:hypothetical protein
MTDPQVRGVPPASSGSNPGKQAIVVIHGIGEQIPMGTLRAFVRGVWETDASLTLAGGAGVNPQEVWSKPDHRTGSLELRRITTRRTKPVDAFPAGVRSDFYELYWADLSAGSTWGHIQAWLFGLLLRGPSRVPARVFTAWVLLWILTLIVATLLLGAVLPRESLNEFPGLLWTLPPFAWISGLSASFLTGLTALFAWATGYVVIPYIGRIVRYTRAIPDNVQARQRIRERGLALLGKLHEREDYERVIVVGHSLGAILAYDLVSYFWATRRDAREIEPGTAEFAALQELEAAAAGMAQAPADAAALDRFLAAQRGLCGHLRKRKQTSDGGRNRRWLITDLVTLGSPLGHAEFLLAKSREDFEQRRDAREFAANPPLREVIEPENVAFAQKAQLLVDTNDPRLCSFPDDANNWVLHHAAAFAAVRWTNIHDPAQAVFFGDIVSSPAAPVFGSGVVDIDLSVRRGKAGKFSHIDYWSVPDKDDPPAHIVELRTALDLAGERLV